MKTSMAVILGAASLSAIKKIGSRSTVSHIRTYGITEMTLLDYGFYTLYYSNLRENQSHDWPSDLIESINFERQQDFYNLLVDFENESKGKYPHLECVSIQTEMYSENPANLGVESSNNSILMTVFYITAYLDESGVEWHEPVIEETMKEIGLAFQSKLSEVILPSHIKIKSGCEMMDINYEPLETRPVVYAVHNDGKTEYQLKPKIPPYKIREMIESGANPDVIKELTKHTHVTTTGNVRRF